MGAAEARVEEAAAEVQAVPAAWARLTAAAAAPDPTDGMASTARRVEPEASQ